MKIWKILFAIVALILIGGFIQLVYDELTQLENEDTDFITFTETYHVIFIRKNPMTRDLYDVTCYEFDPECGCDQEFTIVCKFYTDIPEANQILTFEGKYQNEVYHIYRVL